MDPSSHLGLAHFTVSQLGYIPPWEHEDALGDAYLGLVNAAKDWREDGGANFPTYSRYRIRGEVLDGLRRRTGTRTKNGFVKDPVGPLADYVQPPDPKDHFEEIFDGDFRKSLCRAINRLSDRQKMVITLYFFENMTLNEIGQLYDFSEARACQIVAEISKRLYRVLVEGDHHR